MMSSVDDALLVKWLLLAILALSAAILVALIVIRHDKRIHDLHVLALKDSVDTLTREYRQLRLGPEPPLNPEADTEVVG